MPQSVATAVVAAAMAVPGVDMELVAVMKAILVMELVIGEAVVAVWMTVVDMGALTGVDQVMATTDIALTRLVYSTLTQRDSKTSGGKIWK